MNNSEKLDKMISRIDRIDDPGSDDEINYKEVLIFLRMDIYLLENRIEGLEGENLYLIQQLDQD